MTKQPKDSGLSETMAFGLIKMANISKNGDKRMAAEPNENTGKALLKRGLIEPAGDFNGWRMYRLTDAGRSLADAMILAREATQ